LFFAANQSDVNGSGTHDSQQERDPRRRHYPETCFRYVVKSTSYYVGKEQAAKFAIAPESSDGSEIPSDQDNRY
jgi:hypothetical protein